MEWLRYTYLYVRMKRNPHFYRVSDSLLSADPMLLQMSTDLIHAAANVLDKYSLIKYDRKGGSFQVTVMGRVASYYYISHETMFTFHSYLKPNMTDIEIFRLFSLSGEFKFIHVREEEKMELTKLV